MKTWSCWVALAMGLATAELVGCGGGGDDSGSKEGSAASGTGGAADATSSSNSAANNSINISNLLNTPLVDVSLPVTMLDYSTDIASDFGVLLNAAPADGILTVTATWTATAGGVQIAIPLEFDINKGQLHNPGALAPFSGGVHVSKGQKANVVIINNVAGSVASVHMTVVWTHN